MKMEGLIMDNKTIKGYRVIAIGNECFRRDMAEEIHFLQGMLIF